MTKTAVSTSRLPTKNIWLYAPRTHMILPSRQEKSYLDQAEKTLQNFGGMMAQSPGAFMHMLFATNRYLSTSRTKIRTTHQDQSNQLGSNTEETSNLNLFGLPKAPVDLPAEDELLTLAASIPSTGDIFPGNAFEVEVKIELAEGWHINANPSSWDLLIPTPISIYEDDATVKMKLKLKPGETIEKAFPLKINVRYQACDAHRCLPPSTATIPLWVNTY